MIKTHVHIGLNEDDLAEIDDELGIDGDELRALIGGDRHER